MNEEIMNKIQHLVMGADDRLAQEIEVLEVKNLTPITDYFIIMHARNQRQLDAVVEEVMDVAHEHQYEVKNVEGRRDGKWVLIDLNDVVVHVFEADERAVYNLENIWDDAPRVDISEWITPDGLQ